MNLIEQIQIELPDFRAEDAKAHLAGWNGREHPLDVYRAGYFDAWQGLQARKNFERPKVLSLISTPEPQVWLYAGLYDRVGAPRRHPAHAPHPIYPDRKESQDIWVYRLDRIRTSEFLEGRAKVRFERSFRMSYPNLETISDGLEVVEILREPLSLIAFQGYRHVDLSFPELVKIVTLAPDDWRAALSSVGGVYLITDAEGRHYVGSASGADGIWGRWQAYAETGHGGNRRLRDLIAIDGGAAHGFRFAILETADTMTTREEVLTREKHWKDVLGSRAVGLNLN